MTNTPPSSPAPGIDTSVPHSARVWNYWLGGKDHYGPDRFVAEEVLKVYPDIADVARGSRLFLGRAVQLLAGEQGIRQFLDIGTGLPTADNTHEVAQRVAPGSRIVYVDNDPLVLAHARGLLTSSPEGVCAYVDADARDPAAILEQAARTLDFDRPVGLMLMGILGSLPDYRETVEITDRLVAALAPGSFLALNSGTNSIDPEAGKAAEAARAERGDPYHLRSREEIARYFEGLEMLEPGLVSVTRWRAEESRWGLPDEVCALAGVARKG